MGSDDAISRTSRSMTLRAPPPQCSSPNPSNVTVDTPSDGGQGLDDLADHVACTLNALEHLVRREPQLDAGGSAAQPHRQDPDSTSVVRAALSARFSMGTSVPLSVPLSIALGIALGTSAMPAARNASFADLAHAVYCPLEMHNATAARTVSAQYGQVLVSGLDWSVSVHVVRGRT